MTCLLVRKGLSRQAPLATVIDFFRQSWAQDILPHMVAEEATIVPLLQSSPSGKPFADTILRDHELLRNSVAHLQMEGNHERLLSNLADLLEKHIRYEERIVFQEMQSFIPANKLAQLHIEENQTEPVCNSYPVHFWE